MNINNKSTKEFMGRYDNFGDPDSTRIIPLSCECIVAIVIYEKYLIISLLSSLNYECHCNSTYTAYWPIAFNQNHIC